MTDLRTIFDELTADLVEAGWEIVEADLDPQFAPSGFTTVYRIAEKPLRLEYNLERIAETISGFDHDQVYSYVEAIRDWWGLAVVDFTSGLSTSTVLLSFNGRHPEWSTLFGIVAARYDMPLDMWLAPNRIED